MWGVGWWCSIKGKTLVCTRRTNPGPWLGGVEDSKQAGWGWGGGGGVNWEKDLNHDRGCSRTRELYLDRISRERPSSGQTHIPITKVLWTKILLSLFLFGFTYFVFCVRVWVFCSACMYTTFVPKEVRRGCGSPQLELELMALATMWVLETEHGSSVRAASVFNSWAISPGHFLCFDFCLFLGGKFSFWIPELTILLFQPYGC